MVQVFVSIYKVLSTHRLWAVPGLLVLVACMMVMASRVDFEEDIASFLPVSESRHDYQQAVQQMADESRIVVFFEGQTDSVKQAMAVFETCFADADTAAIVTDLQVTADETRLLDVMTFLSSHAPYFLTVSDYRRIDSLLAAPHYISHQLTVDKSLLQLPTGGLAVQTLSQDPLQLFTPLSQRLQAMGQNSRFRVDDGYVFTNDGRYGLAFFSSPFGISESARNADLAAMLQRVIDRTRADCPGVEVSAVGGPLIAVSNATQIKHDSMLAIAVSVVLILALLVWHYRRVQDLLWIALSLAFGWLFAIAGMSLLCDRVSIIVLGMGSVIIGLAVNYPLHYLDHLRETGDSRQTLIDMVPPLLIGNVTTVSAFLCLVWLDAAAIRNLGLFGSLMLVGTILFVLVALPVLASPPGRRHRDDGGEPLAVAAVTQGRGGYLSAAVFVITLILGYFSLHTSFDSDLHHINYMTDAQRHDLQLMARLSEDMPREMAGMVPSEAVQSERLQLWRAFRDRHAHLTDSLQQEAVRQGFVPDAFVPFVALMDTSLKPLPVDDFAPVSAFLGGQHLINAEHAGAQLVEILQDSFNYVSFVCGFVVFFFLWLSFRRIELALLSFLPLAVSWLWILGLMYLLDIQFNIVNIILATFIFGQGDDYTIFMTEGLVYEHTTGRQRLRSYRRSVILSAVLMFIGIGTLILSRHPALRSLAQVTIIGMGTVVFMAYYLPPLVFRWLVRADSRTGDDAHPSQYIHLRLPLTLLRLLRSLFAMTFFLLFMYLFLLPFTWLYFHAVSRTEAHILRYHQLLQSLSRFVICHVPGVRFHLTNRVGETFNRPAVIISNHQSHLDLMCLMMLTPRIVFLTNDWVWHNPFYGMVVHRAEFYPVSNGIENHVEQLRSLYQRGYSICVFPEGTRSDDCRILRFHQGAFFLARALGADVLPVYLHGVGHVLPKHDFMLRRGRIDVEIGGRITQDDERLRGPLLQCTKTMRHDYQDHYQAMCARIEDAAYWAPYQQLADYYKLQLG